MLCLPDSLSVCLPVDLPICPTCLLACLMPATELPVSMPACMHAPAACLFVLNVKLLYLYSASTI